MSTAATMVEPVAFPERLPQPLAIGLGAALLAGLTTAWTPRYWGISVAVSAVALVALLWALLARQVRLPAQTPMVVPLAVWGGMQLAAHQTVTRWPTILASIAWAMGGVAFVLGSQILSGRHNRRAFLNLLMWAAAILSLAAIFQIYATPGSLLGIVPVADSVVGTFFYKNQFAAMLELTAPIALWKVSEGEIVSGGVCYALMFAAAVVSGSRAGFAVVLAEFVIFLVATVAQRRMATKAVAAVALIIVLLMAVAAVVAGMDKIRQRFSEQNPYALRENLLKSTLGMIPEHPLFGSGLGTWPIVFPRFATFDAGVYINEAHNDWAQWTAEGGIPFTLLLAVLVAWLVPSALRSIWGLGVLGVMIHSLLDYPLREPSLMFLWFTLAGALTQVRRDPTDGALHM